MANENQVANNGNKVAAAPIGSQASSEFTQANVLQQAAQSRLAQMNQLTDILRRMRVLSLQAANGTYSEEDRAAIQIEVNQLNDEISRIENQVDFNKMKLGTLLTNNDARDKLLAAISTEAQVVANNSAGQASTALEQLARAYALVTRAGAARFAELAALELNRNPLNFFDEIEQLAFAPAHLLPYIEPTPDPLFAIRRRR